MKQQYLIFGLFAIIAILLFSWTKLKNKKSQAESVMKDPTENIFTKSKVANDKLVIVENASEKDIQKILQEFCYSYNKETTQAILQLTKLSDGKFAITFPYDINFEIYCYFINYVNYPIGFDRHFKTIGWTTTKPIDRWTTDKSVNKKVMLFVSDFDKEYDNVFLTTSNNIGYKLGFAVGEENQLLNSPEKSYVKPPINISQIDTNESIYFK